MAHYQAGQKLTAGQVNTIAHQGIQLIEEQILATNQGTVTFTSIPQNFQTLWLVMSAGNDSTSPVALVAQFNGDTGSNYMFHRFIHVGDGTSTNRYFGTNDAIELGAMNSNLLAQNSVYFPGYSRTDREKSALVQFAAPHLTSGSSELGLGGGIWHSTSAITQIELGESSLDGTIQVLAGSIFTLYGLGDTSS